MDSPDSDIFIYKARDILDSSISPVFQHAAMLAFLGHAPSSMIPGIDTCAVSSDAENGVPPCGQTTVDIFETSLSQPTLVYGSVCESLDHVSDTDEEKVLVGLLCNF